MARRSPCAIGCRSLQVRALGPRRGHGAAPARRPRHSAARSTPARCQIGAVHSDSRRAEARRTRLRRRAGARRGHARAARATPGDLRRRLGAEFPGRRAGRGGEPGGAGRRGGAGGCRSGGPPLLRERRRIGASGVADRHLAARRRPGSRSITPVLEDLDLDGALLRLHHGDDVAALHGVAGLDQPFDQCARPPCRRRARACGTRPMLTLDQRRLRGGDDRRGTCGSAASSRCLA